MSEYLVAPKKLLKNLAVLGLITGLVGCGGGGGGSAADNTLQNAGSTQQAGGTTVTTSSMTMTWTAPVARSDGAPLTPSAIGGFRIYYGTSPGNYPNQLDITDSTATSYTVSNVPAGTYYFVMTAYDTAGRESIYSPVTAQAVN